MGPEIQPDVPLIEVVAYGALNPATVAVAMLMGRYADERSKLLIAAFVGAVAGSAMLYVAALIGILDAPTIGRAAVGAFVVSLVVGLLYAWIGFALKR